MKEAKLYVGKVFTLKKVYRIPWSTKLTNKTITSLRKDFGDRVLVVDEQSKKVLVVSNMNKPVWISKFYLHNVISQKVQSSEGELITAMSELTDIASALGTDHNLSQKIYGVLKRLEGIKENLEKDS